jgi:hypothetical protein
MKRHDCAVVVANNWRLRRRLPRITRLASQLGYVTLTPEEKARALLSRVGVEGAYRYSAGELVELANLIAMTRI